MTTIALNSRTKLIEALLQKDLPYNLGLMGSGQDVSFMRSTLFVPGLLSQDQHGCTLTENACDNRLTAALNEITTFFEKTKFSLAFPELEEKINPVSLFFKGRPYIRLDIRKPTKKVDALLQAKEAFELERHTGRVLTRPSD